MAKASGVAMIFVVPLAIVGLLILMVAEPWQANETANEATKDEIEYRVCNTSVFVPSSPGYEPDEVRVYPLFVPAGDPTRGYLMIETKHSTVAIDGVAGTVDIKSVAPSDEALLTPILASTTVGAGSPDEPRCGSLDQ